MKLEIIRKVFLLDGADLQMVMNFNGKSCLGLDTVFLLLCRKKEIPWKQDITCWTCVIPQVLPDFDLSNSQVSL